MKKIINPIKLLYMKNFYFNFHCAIIAFVLKLFVVFNFFADIPFVKKNDNIIILCLGITSFVFIVKAVFNYDLKKKEESAKSLNEFDREISEEDNKK